jgi:hypothetical protein
MLQAITDSYTDEIKGHSEWNFQGLRMNWIRYQACSSLSVSLGKIPDHKEMHTQIAALVYQCSWIDNFDISLEKLSSLSTLYYHRPSLIEHLRDTIDLNLNEQAKYICAFAEIASDFMEHASGSWIPLVSQSCEDYAGQVYSIIGKLTALMAHELLILQTMYEKLNHAKENVTGNQAAPPEKRRPTLVKQRTIDRTGTKPGMESDFRYPERVSTYAESLTYARVASLKKCVRSLLKSLTSPLFVLVYESEFFPIQFFASELATEFACYLKSGVSRATDVLIFPKASITSLGNTLANLSATDDEVKRPSVFLLEIKAYLSGAEWLQDFLNIDLMKKLQDVYLSQINPIAYFTVQ